MISQLLITITLACSSPQLDGIVLNTVHGASAEALFQTLSPTDSVNWLTLGTLYANRIFMLESGDKRRDADSALYYFRKAQKVCPANPVIAAYIAVATGLRAKEDGFWRKITGKTKDQAHEAFMVTDSLLRSNPDNLAVQFLGACLLREASKHFDDARDFQLTSHRAFQKLHNLALAVHADVFFTPDVHGQILLSLALLEIKLATDEKPDVLSCQYITQLLVYFSDSPAAEYAREKKLQCE